MQRTRPLPGHPEFTIVNHLEYREYRVENFFVARDGSGRIVRRATGFSWYWTVLPVLLGLAQIQGWRWLGVLVMVTIAFIYNKLTQVVAETIVVIPRHGVQLETHRGLPGWPLLTSRRFIPLLTVQDVVINEGLRGWNVRYYLAAVKEHPTSGFSLDVAFENILPRLTILLEVYHGIHELLFTEKGQMEEMGDLFHCGASFR